MKAFALKIKESKLAKRIAQVGLLYVAVEILLVVGMLVFFAQS